MEQCQVDVLVFAEALTLSQRRQNARHVQPGEHVGQGRAHLERPAADLVVGQARNAHEAEYEQAVTRAPATQLRQRRVEPCGYTAYRSTQLSKGSAREPRKSHREADRTDDAKHQCCATSFADAKPAPERHRQDPAI
jgi:hypothetical protein